MEEILENVLALCSLLAVSGQNTAQGHQHLTRQTEILTSKAFYIVRQMPH